ncbi:MAG TPA: hypothetical protein EYH23_01905 [Euryarchaeota archaeon]|nr:hypothetical protein [Euryarchaeota archaeon]HIQ10250.1 hypothetical protein [Euryarchaeota archaeon]
MPGNFKKLVHIYFVVFEYLFGTKNAEGSPITMFVAGFVYSFISVPLALILHKSAASVLAVALATIAGIPLILKIIEFESDLLDLYPETVLAREAKIIALYLWFFFGEIAGFTSSYLLLNGDDFSAATSYQMKDLEYVEGLRSKITGQAASKNPFEIVFWNNLKVYAIGMLLSFIYGTGGVFILTWNASVIATLLARDISTTGSITAGVLQFLSILPHGILEYGAYIVGGFTGGLISLLLLQKGWNKRLIFDTVVLLVSGVVLLYVGAVVESAVLLSR